MVFRVGGLFVVCVQWCCGGGFVCFVFDCLGFGMG